MATPKLSVLKQALFKLFETFDENNDKLIDFEEFKKAMIESGFIQANAPKLQQQITQLFAMFDTDGSGTIKYTEFMHENSKFISFLNELNIEFIDDTNKQEYEVKMLQKYQDEKETLETNLKICLQKNQAMSEEIEQLRKEKKNLFITLNELKTEINELKHDKIQLQSLSQKLKNNYNGNHSEKEINELNKILQQKTAHVETEKQENNKLSSKIKTLSSKINKLQNINKQLKYDNNQFIESTDELTVYCTELEVNLEIAENKITDLGNESLYDNITPIENRDSIKQRTRTGTLYMGDYDKYDVNTVNKINEEYDQFDVDDPLIDRNVHVNRRRSMQLLRNRSNKQISLTNVDVGYVDNNNNNNNNNNTSSMKDIKDILLNIKSDIKILNTNVNNYQQSCRNEKTHSDAKSWWEWW